MNDIDKRAAGAFEDSALVQAIERGALTLNRWRSNSAALAAAAEWVRGVRSRIGDVLVAAMITHIVLMITIAQPPTWHWLILPAIVLMAGVVLIVTAPPDQRHQ